MRLAARAASFGWRMLNEHAQELAGNGFACCSRIFENRVRFPAVAEVRRRDGASRGESVLPLSEGLSKGMILRHVQWARIKG
jgi:hypothetical protein